MKKALILLPTLALIGVSGSLVANDTSVSASTDLLNSSISKSQLKEEKILYQTDFEQNSGMFNAPHMEENGNGFIRIENDTFAGAAKVFNLEQGKTYKMECDVKTPDSGYTMYSFDMHDVTLQSLIDPIPAFIALGNTWQHEAVTFKAKTTSTYETNILIKAVAGKVLDVDNFKLTMLDD